MNENFENWQCAIDIYSAWGGFAGSFGLELDSILLHTLVCYKPYTSKGNRADYHVDHVASYDFGLQSRFSSPFGLLFRLKTA